ncbi:MAG: hypothetical protein EZS28_029131, partial [Streblomastix strix]
MKEDCQNVKESPNFSIQIASTSSDADKISIEQVQITRSSSDADKISFAKWFDSNCQQFLAQKIFDILQGAVLGAGDVISVSSITLFFKYLKQSIHMLFEEGIIAVALLQRFVSKQTTKKVKTLNLQNIGTMLVVLVIVSLKTCREVVSDSFFAKEFDILPAVLNQSETA